MMWVQKIFQTAPFFLRHLIARHTKSYEKVLKRIKAQQDIWKVSQGEYIRWWVNRENSILKVEVFEGKCRASTSLEKGVIERFPGEFLETPAVSSVETDFSGEVWISIDSNLKKKELLIEVLKREGILNFRVSDKGPIHLMQKDLGAILDDIDEGLHRWRASLDESSVRAVRQILIDKLAAHKLPLFRLWYHPRIDGHVVRAVFSVRHDVDRALSNLSRIRALEEKYGVPSTFYLRVFSPFYSDNEIEDLALKPWCSEIALHGEFVSHKNVFGDEFAAAKAEKTHLEKLTGLPVTGVSMHGGELTYNISENTDSILQKTMFVYHSVPRPNTYYFPFKRMINGDLSNFYLLPVALSDVSLFPFRVRRTRVNGKIRKSYDFLNALKKVKTKPFWDYNQFFYEEIISKMDDVYEQNGILFVTFHPSYFGFFSYLVRPQNWYPVYRYMRKYLNQ